MTTSDLPETVTLEIPYRTHTKTITIPFDMYLEMKRYLMPEPIPEYAQTFNNMVRNRYSNLGIKNLGETVKKP